MGQNYTFNKRSYDCLDFTYPIHIKNRHTVYTVLWSRIEKDPSLTYNFICTFKFRNTPGPRIVRFLGLEKNRIK